MTAPNLSKDFRVPLEIHSRGRFISASTWQIQLEVPVIRTSWHMNRPSVASLLGM